MKKIILWALLAVLMSGPSYAAPKPLTLEMLLMEAEENNASVQAARELWLGAAKIPKLAGALPDPKVLVVVPLQSVETRGGPIQGKASVSQAIPFPGKRGAAARAASFEAGMAEQGYRAVVFEVRAHASHLALELFHCRRQIEILEEQIELLRHYSRVAEKKYASGKGSQAAVFRSQAELSLLKNHRAKMIYKAHAEELRLLAVLGRSDGSSIGSLVAKHFEGFDADLEQLQSRASNSRPELLAAKAAEGMSQAKRRLAIKRYFPDFLIGYEKTKIGEIGSGAQFDGRDAHAFSLGLSIPIWGRANRAGANAARHREKAASLKREDLERRTAAEVAELYARSSMLVEVTGRHEDVVIPQFRSVLSAAQSGYEANSVSFETLLDAQRDLLNQEIFHVRHHVELAKLRSLMERLIGGSL